MNDATLTLEQNKAVLQSTATPARRKVSTGSRLEQFGALLFFSGVSITLYRGWINRNDLSRTAESGIGYALGIIGGILMLLLLLYPLRKRARFMQRLGPVKWWFRSHMILGIVGPMCILFHCSFHLGALNSNVSLLCMTLVASTAGELRPQRARARCALPFSHPSPFAWRASPAGSVACGDAGTL